ncbi:MAG: hypothetical protein QG670_2834 [Thermoproteota archaeon]|nr:hypothetical protein [Thermoproteota archaeon]
MNWGIDSIISLGCALMGLESSSSVAFILSLIGGILILIGGIASLMWFMLNGSTFWGMMGGYGGMMGGWGWMIGNYGFPFGFMGGFSLVALVSGVFVIIGALMLKSRQAEHTTWGIIILVFSIASFVGMGGFVIGALLGISGGALALSWRPSSSAS